MPAKLDLRKEFKHLYSPSPNKVEVVNVPRLKFLMLDGEIPLNVKVDESREYQDAVGALYGAAYTLKFMSKLRARNPIDYTVMALEGLWWTPSGIFDWNRHEPWCWTMMIMVPDHITDAMFHQALDQLGEKKPNPALAKLRLEPFREGKCIQMMHIGPYAEEKRTIDQMDAFAQAEGLKLIGKHHEIYLGDPRRAKPDRLKTILRHPFEK